MIENRTDDCLPRQFPYTGLMLGEFSLFLYFWALHWPKLHLKWKIYLDTVEDLTTVHHSQMQLCVMTVHMLVSGSKDTNPTHKIRMLVNKGWHYMFSSQFSNCVLSHQPGLLVSNIKIQWICEFWNTSYCAAGHELTPATGKSSEIINNPWHPTRSETACAMQVHFVWVF